MESEKNDVRKIFRKVGFFLSVAGILVIAFALTQIPDQEVQFQSDGWNAEITDLGGDFTLTGHEGTRVSLHDFKGKVALIFFGYTYCPDVCPTGLSDIASAIDMLGDRADDARAIFISVDPERDTPERLKEYTEFFHKDMVGLTGSREEIDKVTDQYASAYMIGKPDETGYYSVGHTATTYLVDGNGEVRHMFSYGTPPEQMAEVIKKYLN